MSSAINGPDGMGRRLERQEEVGGLEGIRKEGDGMLGHTVKVGETGRTDTTQNTTDERTSSATESMFGYDASSEKSDTDPIQSPLGTRKFKKSISPETAQLDESSSVVDRMKATVQPELKDFTNNATFTEVPMEPFYDDKDALGDYGDFSDPTFTEVPMEPYYDGEDALGDHGDFSVGIPGEEDIAEDSSLESPPVEGFHPSADLVYRPEKFEFPPDIERSQLPADDDAYKQLNDSNLELYSEEDSELSEYGKGLDLKWNKQFINVKSFDLPENEEGMASSAEDGYEIPLNDNRLELPAEEELELSENDEGLNLEYYRQFANMESFDLLPQNEEQMALLSADDDGLYELPLNDVRLELPERGKSSLDDDEHFGLSTNSKGLLDEELEGLFEEVFEEVFEDDTELLAEIQAIDRARAEKIGAKGLNKERTPITSNPKRMLDVINKIVQCDENHGRALGLKVLEKYVGHKLKENPIFMLKTAKILGVNALKCASERIRGKEEFMIIAGKMFGLEALVYGSDDFNGNELSMINAARLLGVEALAYASFSFKRNKEYILEAVMLFGPEVLRYASRELQRDRTFVSDVKNYSKNHRTYRLKIKNRDDLMSFLAVRRAKFLERH